MSAPLSRREFLSRSLAAAVVGYSAASRSWITAADVYAVSVSDFPSFDGVLLTDEAALASAAKDYGHIVQRRPMAVLQPGSINDVVKLVRFARTHGIGVAARGQGHSTQGQAQAEAGVVIEMSHLSRIREVTGSSALVDGGVRWIDLLQETLASGLTPPTLTDFIELSVAGTLSVGGIGGQTYWAGPQVDNVLELEVVTGAGDLVTCSPQQHADLFNACRSGLGQFGIIVGARVRLVPAPAMAKVYHAVYLTPETLMLDQQRLIAEGRFEYVEGFAFPNSPAGWIYVLEAAKYFNPGEEPDDTQMLAGLSFVPTTQTATVQSYFDFANRLAPMIEGMRADGSWYLPHPWINLFLPASQAPLFIQTTMATLDPADLGGGPIIIYPMYRSRFSTPFFRVPDSERFFLFAVLRAAVPATDEHISKLIADNRRLYERCRMAGGKRYPIDSVPMGSGDWQAHFDPLWGKFNSSKRHFDPAGILAPGQGIF